MARPDQCEPAVSATAVNAKPLSTTVTTLATMMTATAAGVSTRSPSASIVTAAATATCRMGRNRLATWSVHHPAPMRPRAPSSWATSTRAPASPAANPRASISHTSMKVQTVYCGTTSRADARWMRTSPSRRRYGFTPPGVELSRGSRAGSTIATAHRTAVRATISPTATSIVVSPRDETSVGVSTAPMPMPRGRAVCRMPIAVPRRWGPNQPTTSRPLEEFGLAAPTPTTNHQAPSAT